jgi:hypothetical protein
MEILTAYLLLVFVKMVHAILNVVEYLDKKKKKNKLNTNAKG